MASTRFADTAEVASAEASGMMNDIVTSIRGAVADLEILRTGLALAEDWILECNIDFETRIAVSEAFDPSSLTTATGESTSTLAATGAVLGDFVQISHDKDIIDQLLTGYVQSSATVEGRLDNLTAGTLHADTGTIRYLVTPKAASMLSGAITASVLSASAFDAAADLSGFGITIS